MLYFVSRVEIDSLGTVGSLGWFNYIVRGKVIKENLAFVYVVSTAQKLPEQSKITFPPASLS